MNLSINNSETDLLNHACETRREGDWVIHTCPHCTGYERRQNLKTGAMKVRNGDNPEALHHGSFVPELIAKWQGNAN